jgi:hypothetical protein
LHLRPDGAVTGIPPTHAPLKGGLPIAAEWAENGTFRQIDPLSCRDYRCLNVEIDKVENVKDPVKARMK